MRGEGMTTKKKRRFTLSTTHVILLSFLLVILVGSGLLSLPFATAEGVSVPYVDALFTATTSTFSSMASMASLKSKPNTAAGTNATRSFQ